MIKHGLLGDAIDFIEYSAHWKNLAQLVYQQRPAEESSYEKKQDVEKQDIGPDASWKIKTGNWELNDDVPISKPDRNVSSHKDITHDDKDYDTSDATTGVPSMGDNQNDPNVLNV